MTTKQRNKIYEDFVNENPKFIKEKVKSFSWKYNIQEIQDILISEAQMIVLESIEKYNKDKGSLKSWFSVSVFNGLRKFISDNLENDFETYSDNYFEVSSQGIDADSCINFLYYFEKLHKFEMFIIISFYFNNRSITELSKQLNRDRKRIRNIIDNYSVFIRQALKEEFDLSYEIFNKEIYNENAN